MSMAMGKTPRYIVKLNKQNGELYAKYSTICVK